MSIDIKQIILDLPLTEDKRTELIQKFEAEGASQELLKELDSLMGESIAVLQDELYAKDYEDQIIQDIQQAEAVRDQRLEEIEADISDAMQGLREDVDAEAAQNVRDAM